MRWGDDGVGMQFIFSDNKNSRPSNVSADALIGGANQAHLKLFLARIKARG